MRRRARLAAKRLANLDPKQGQVSGPARSWERPENKRPRGIYLWGVPLTFAASKYFLERLKKVYLRRSAGDADQAIRLVVADSDLVVSRAAVVAASSAVLIAVYLYLAEKIGPSVPFYVFLAIWIAATMWLLYTLRFAMPSATDFGGTKDLEFSLGLYVQRQRAFNIALAVTVFTVAAMPLCFVSHDVYKVAFRWLTAPLLQVSDQCGWGVLSGSFVARAAGACGV